MKRLFLYCCTVLIFFAAGDVWAYTAEECIECHNEGSEDSSLHISVKDFEMSAHGPGVQCQDCHTNVRDDAHTSEEGSGAVPGESCKGCHPAAFGEVDSFSWLPSFQIASHAKQDFAHAYEMENCVGCHQGRAAHGEKEPIDDQNCYQCHVSPTGQNGLWGYMHPRADSGKHPGIFFAGLVYRFFLGILFIVAVSMMLNFIFDNFPGKA